MESKNFVPKEIKFVPFHEIMKFEPMPEIHAIAKKLDIEQFPIVVLKLESTYQKTDMCGV